MSKQMLFEADVDGSVMYRLPGEPTDKLMPLEQASKHFNMATDVLRRRWVSTWSELFPPDQLATFDPAPSPLYTGERAGVRGDDSSTGSSALADAPTELVEMARLNVAHVIYHPALSDEEYEQVLKICRLRGLQPWQVFTKRQWDPEAPGDGTSEKPGALLLRVLLRIEAMRAIAHSTNEYGGSDDVTYEYADDPDVPAKARITVYRLVAGQPRAHPASVLWKEFYKVDGPAEFRDQMPHEWLGKVVEAKALRKAFAERLGGLYTAEELAHLPDGPGGGGARTTSTRASSSSADARPAAPAGDIVAAIDEDTPQTPMQMNRWLWERGVTDAGRRDRIVGEFRAKHVRLHNEYPQVFYAKLIADIESRPTVYGISPQQVSA